ncbi:hypothetical protein AGOR_G00052760 [Albula goreensis]|uniref:Large ribosomal subunit protein uL10 n=2 Tax=Euteleostomi TaxID=117571 RepID=A0A8T3DXP0_9TELE|nr:hypothetical protein AGOR_G00052760 [Albula goreensis]
MPREDRATWKSNYFMKIIQLLDEYPKCFIVGADNVGSKQMQTIRLSLRGKAVVLMGKNTMMRKAIRGHLENNPALEKLLPHIRGNVGFVFTKEDLTEVRDMLLANKVPAAARAGAIAPCDVTVPAQNTGLGPEKTSFFQALGITTKISRGTIEILSDVQLIKTGDKVGASEATLLNMLNISPFSFGLIIQQVYDNGSVYSPEVLDITEDALHQRFLEGVRNIASVCLEIGYPTLASIPHSIINGYKRVLAVAVETDYSFPLADKVPAAARAGAIAPCDVTVPAQNTGLGPEKTSFFQALGITTKISRGTIEILSDVQLIKTGDKVGASEATLLNMLNISPFSFGLIIQQVYDNGSVYSPEVLDITEDALHQRFLEGVRNIASVCLEIGYPTLASIPHSIINGYKRVLAVAVETDYSFPLADKVKAFLADPSAFAVAAPVAEAADAAAAPAAKEEVKEESEESDDDMGFGLFD